METKIIYYKEENGIINKYDVSFDYELLMELRKEIIEKCSKINHMEEDILSINCKTDFTSYEIKNINRSSKSVRVIEHTDAADEYLYHYSYDKYEYPLLVSYINKLLHGDGNAIDLIFNPSKINESLSFKEQMKKASKDFEKISLIDDLKIRNKLFQDLNKSITDAQINKNQISSYPYYEKVQNTISFKLIDSINKSDIDRVLDFYNLTNNEINKIKEKTN